MFFKHEEKSQFDFLNRIELKGNVKIELREHGNTFVKVMMLESLYEDKE
jgi:hypothetical protein